jgi:hypothetical protein
MMAVPLGYSCGAAGNGRLRQFGWREIIAEADHKREIFR